MVDYAAVARAYAQDIVDHGGELRSGVSVRALQEVDGAVEVMGTGPRQEEVGVLARVPRAVACAGGWADRLAAASGARPDIRIVPFRGAYLTLTPEKAHLVRGQIYPVPDPALPFLGVHLSRTVGGDVLIGPTALLVGARDAYRLALIRPADLSDALRWPGTWRLIRRFWRTGVKELRTAASKRVLARDAAQYVPAITAADVRPGPAGVRAQALGRDGALVDDFLLARTGRALHVLNAPSPAATASLAIGDAVADELDR
jgi:2-hydroxyglutarate dehydrogenase